jgi:hypothetical protein
MDNINTLISIARSTPSNTALCLSTTALRGMGGALPAALVDAAATWYASPARQVVTPGHVAREISGVDE